MCVKFENVCEDMFLSPQKEVQPNLRSDVND